WERRGEDLREADPGAQPALDPRDEVGHAGELALNHQLGPAHRARYADPGQVVALEVDDHHVLGGVLVVVDVLACRALALDRHGDELVAAAPQEELGRAGDDRPAVAL